MSEQQSLDVIRAYLRALEQAATGDALARFFTTDAVQIELPNRLNPNGGRSDLPTLLQRAALVPDLLQSQEYEIVSQMAAGAKVVIESLWTGVLAVPFGTVAAGTRLKAHFAMFFELQEGRIKSQRNYDCFAPW
jgi:ketosteroid isomerase-like protein